MPLRDSADCCCSQQRQERAQGEEGRGQRAVQAVGRTTVPQVLDSVSRTERGGAWAGGEMGEGDSHLDRHLWARWHSGEGLLCRQSFEAAAGLARDWVALTGGDCQRAEKQGRARAVQAGGEGVEAVATRLIVKWGEERVGRDLARDLGRGSEVGVKQVREFEKVVWATLVLLVLRG